MRSGAPHSVGNEAVGRLVTLALEDVPRTPRIGARASRQTALTRAKLQSRAFGAPSARGRTRPTPSSCPLIRLSSRRCATLSASTWRRRSVHWCCVYEKPQNWRREVQRLPFLCEPGRAERRTHDHGRHCTLDLFASLDVKAGKGDRGRRAAIVSSSFAASLIRSKGVCHWTSMCTSFSTI